VKLTAVLALVTALGIAACMRDAPTAPTDNTDVVPAVDSAAVKLRIEALADARGALTDVMTRLLPAMEDQEAAEELRGHLSRLTTHLEADNVRASRSAAQEAQTVVSRMSARDAAADLTDLSFVQLALDQVGALLRDDTEAARQ
jgi:hypothetical protein